MGGSEGERPATRPIAWLKFRFIQARRRTILARTIGIWHVVDDRHRTHLVNDFPYQIVYRILGENVVVVAVAHAKRRMKYWAERN